MDIFNGCWDAVGRTLSFGYISRGCCIGFGIWDEGGPGKSAGYVYIGWSAIQGFASGFCFYLSLDDGVYVIYILPSAISFSSSSEVALNDPVPLFTHDACALF